MKRESAHPWLKNRGYLHLTNQLNIQADRDRILRYVRSPVAIAKHAFFPLIHSIIRERRYKKHKDNPSGKKSHSFKNPDGTSTVNYKKRPLHYATHLDAVIFGYYSSIIIEKYESYLSTIPGLSECITAYRRIPTEIDGSNKSTIHFAHEVFSEIKKRSETGHCVALKFDIKSFFNEIDHSLLKYQWAELLGLKKLPADHYNVFKAATRFSYIMRDDFRLDKRSYGKRLGFDEKKLAKLRKKGVHAFFGSAREFREALKNGEIKLHTNPFTKDGKVVGIPQGLPISATLANLYLLMFDKDIAYNLGNKLDVYYRRYSDDIIVLCNEEQMDYVTDYVIKSIQQCRVVISEEKTERFIFKMEGHSNKKNKLESYKYTSNNELKPGVPFTYLGFEFYGHKTLIKSSNLAKYYRRMIRTVKSKTRRAVIISNHTPGAAPIIYHNQIKRLYNQFPLNASAIRVRHKYLQKNDQGDFHYVSKEIPAKNRSNYLSYANRASLIMDEPAIWNQLRKRHVILNQAIHKHLKKNVDRI